ncbi:MAG: hypothetical protein QOJ59_2149 [Thermomicrobiales bacterium]|nr:hypothetical protein [Thermomicrobiales bacterium]
MRGDVVEPRSDRSDEEEIDINLRSPSEVGRRLVVLATLCRRAFLEPATSSEELDEDPEAERFDLATWLDEHNLAAELTDQERALLGAPVGTLSGDEAHAATWNAEALVALGWAVGLVSVIPDPIDPADPNPVLQAIPGPWDDPRGLIDSITLCPEERSASERERAEIWLWRAETEEERRRLRGRALLELEGDLRDVVRQSVEAGLINAGVEGDFPVAGRPFRTLDENRIDVAAGVAAVRLHALNWLCGFGTTWDDVPLDVD